MIDQDLLAALQYALIEPADGGASWLSGLWSRDEVLQILTVRQAQILKSTGLIVQTATLTAVAGTHRYTLPGDTVRLIDVVWTGADAVVRTLVRVDSFEADHAIPTWDTTDVVTPLAYMESEAPTLTVQIAPAPSQAGTLDLLYVPSGTAVTGDGVPLTVPDELAHALKYGALADLLHKDGRAQDPVRASYAADRFDLAVELTRLMQQGWA